ncbi:YfhO family protein [Odoribacter splanchnicus]|jgi:hypothetical protein|uniref:YfhO family protein n=1 Tax=Odoribacter splanchnicus TaxID=28118 RepID=A0AAW5CFP5_9BACT|nr:YfhO family protein [Odoribacter splanchnicus]MBV4274783.1 YfhO family protein [Odoribacter splanchnicus]MBV4290001.1 YfhO family protein [Odoribacter splanchnicus]MBV4399667.1 YfhO family protein [Odoribacter splanchnicus]MBV4408243.1 YfhO family protein [Odoribacter splanchnicus]MCG4960958.1 YfhO family protein [Odoribacter splanchnicus]
MNVKINWRSVGPQLLILLLFVLIAFIYCLPVLQGKALLGHDLESWMYMAKEALDFNAQSEVQTFWTNSMFGGMPTYQITPPIRAYNVLNYMYCLWIWMPSPVVNIFLYLVGSYVLLLCFKFDKWMAFMGALALSFISYNLIILAAGHVTKAAAIAFCMPVLGAVYQLFRGNKWIGMLLTALFLTLAINANHLQILYYTLYVVLIFGLVELVYACKDKEIKKFGVSVGLGCIALLLAVGLNAPMLLTTYQYSKATMRGESNGLTGKDGEVAGHGLDKDYITNWSYGVDESFTLLVPDFKGGASGGLLTEKSETGKALKQMGVPNVKETMKDFQLPLYWGTQPFTSGPVYLGAVLCFLFVLGLFLVDKRTKWWLLSVIILTIMLSWGRNFMPLTDFFIDYIPLYNKFRTVSMILVVTCLCMTLFGLLGLKVFLNPLTGREKMKKALKYAFYITGGLCLLFVIIPSLSGNFIAQGDSQFTGNYKFLSNTLPLDRESLLRQDAFRSLIFIALAAGLLWLYLKSKLNLRNLYIGLTVLILIDLWVVDKRYLNDRNFVNPKNEKQLVQPTEADRFILQDKSYYRVLDASVNIFNDARPAFFHKNIGGYHAAKLSRYQELIDYHLQTEIQVMMAGLAKVDSEQQLKVLMSQLGVLNMLNMKYVIYNPQTQPIINTEANGNAWFVDSYLLAENADQEMQILGEIDTKHQLVVDKRFADGISSISDRDSSATITLKSYAPNRLVYNVDTKTNQIAVFSEIYYRDGWNAYVNGEQQPYFRANYLLRAMPLKAGNYELEFRFEPQVVTLSTRLSLIASVLFLILTGFVIYREYRKKKSTVN